MTDKPTEDQTGTSPARATGDDHPVEEVPVTGPEDAVAEDGGEAAEPTEPTEPTKPAPAEPAPVTERADLGEPAEAMQPAEAAESTGPEETGQPPARRFTATRAVVVVLLGLLGFTLAIQVRSVSDDPELAALGQEDLVRILANLDDHEERLREDIAELQETKRRLTTAGESRQEALAEAQRRADELGILAGTLPVEGQGITVELHTGPGAVTAATLLDAVQELRSAGAEAMQIEGGGAAVRVVASTYIVDAEGRIVVDGVTLRSPYLLTAIGEPQTLAPALTIPSGVVESVEGDGGTVTVQDVPGGVEVSTVREPGALQYARPVS